MSIGPAAAQTGISSVGYALGKGIPVISLKLQAKDPPGFIDNVQAQRGSIEQPANSAASIYRLISEVLGAKERLSDGLVAAFVASEDYNDARYRFDRMANNVEKLTDGQLKSITKGYNDNGRATIDTGELPAGMYVVRLANAQGVQVGALRLVVL